MKWSIRQLTQPADEPLTLNQVKSHLRIELDYTDEDTYLDELRIGVRDEIEQLYGIRCMKQTVELLIQQFPAEDRIRFPVWPVQSVDYIHYIDIDGVSGDVEINTTDRTVPYSVTTRLYDKPAEIVLDFAKVWPTKVLRTADAIQIGLTVGFVTGHSPEGLPFPPSVITCMRRLIEHGYRNRSAVTIGSLLKSEPLQVACDRLMANVRLYWGM